jgi:hypothetical protein
MTVNFEVKGMLARLLATEDLIVEHKKVETACFNVHTRVLTLPMWQKASSGVYDMLVAHEVSHALYTPDEDWTEQVQVPPQFVNVCEDARVEKLMKRRYAGLAKTFYGAYRELQEDDFFQVGDDDLSTYNLADRVNLYFKIGNFLTLEFTKREQEIVDMIGKAETFTETLDAAKVLYEYCTQKQEETIQLPSIDNHEQSPGSGAGDKTEEQQELFPEEDGEGGEDKQQTSGSEQQTQGEKFDNQNIQQTGGEHADPDVKTMSSLEESLKELVNNNIQETNYLELPKLNMDSVIISNQIIHETCKETWQNQIYVQDNADIFANVDTDYVNFKRSAQKEVNYLVKEFECRKAADSYARASVSKTGVLDCTKLHTYKYQEDLFKKVTTFANGKNHGLVFVLDWSGSMNNVLMDTVKQLYNLIWFCNKVNIPFEVYAFTNDWNYRSSYDADGKVTSTPKEHTPRKENELAIDYSFGLMNLLTSKVKSSVLDTHLKNIYRVAKCHDRSNNGGYYCSYQPPHRMSLSGTPLNEALVSLHQILPKFQSENKLQKVQCVVLTDGEAAPLKYYREIKRNWENGESYLGCNYVTDNAYLRDRKTGNVYKFSEKNWNNASSFTDLLLRNLRDNFPSVNFIGMRILESRDAGHFVRNYTGYTDGTYDKLMTRWKKERSFAITSSGYHTYFGLSSSALNSDTEFKVAEDASKAQIKTAFAKSLSSKKMNKKILGEFIQLVA